MLEPRGEQRIVRRRERQLVDDDDRQRVAGHVDALPEARAAEQHRVAGLAESHQQLGLRAVALDQQRPRQVLGGDRAGEELAGDVERAQAGEEQERTAAARAQHRQRGGDHRLGVLARVGLGQAARHVQQRLRRVVERRLPAAGGRVGQPQLALVEREVAGDRQRRRREDPGATGVLHLLRERGRDRQRRRVQQEALRRHVDPADPVAGRFGGDGSRGDVVVAARAVRSEPFAPAPQSRLQLRGAPGDRREVLAALGEEAELGGGAIERRRQLGQRGRKTVAPQRRALRELAGAVTEREPQLPDRGAEVGRGGGQVGHFAGAGAGGHFRVARELRQRAGRHLLAEEQRRGIRQLVRLVEDDRVARGQQLGQPFVAEHDVGEEQVMIDDDDVGLERRLARLHHEALAEERAVAAEAAVPGRRHQRPDAGVLGDVGQLAAVAGLARAGERDDLRQVAGVVARRQPAVRRRALQMVVADVIGATLEQRQRGRRTQRVADQRQVALIELVLQRLGAGRDDDLPAVEQRGNQVGEGLAGAGAGLGDQRAPRRDRVGHCGGHRQLLVPVAEAGQLPGQRPALAEDRGEIGVVGPALRGNGGGRADGSRGRVGGAGQFGALTAAVFVLAAGFALATSAAAGAGVTALASAVRTASARSVKYL